MVEGSCGVSQLWVSLNDAHVALSKKAVTGFGQISIQVNGQ